MDADHTFKRQWRDYRTVLGNRPVKDFSDALADEDAAEIAQAMTEVAQEGLVAARHLRGDSLPTLTPGMVTAYPT